MEILEKWRTCKKELEEEKVLNIALRVLEHIKEWKKISPYNLKIEELSNGDVQIEWCPETDEDYIKDAEKAYLEGVGDVVEAFDGNTTLGEWFPFVSLIYYLVVGNFKNDQFSLWKLQIRTRGQLMLPEVGEGTGYEYLGSLIKSIQQESIDCRRIMEDIIGKYPPYYKIEFYSDITKRKLPDVHVIVVRYDGGTNEDTETVVTRKETDAGKAPQFQIHFDRMPQLQQLKQYCLVKKEIIQNYMISAKEQYCKCYLCPDNWKNWAEFPNKGYEKGSDDNTLEPKKTAEVLEAYFDAYQEPKRYLLIYAHRDGHGVIAYFDNKLLRRNQIRQWKYQESKSREQLLDEIEYMRLKNEEIDSICIAASDMAVEEELIGIIWELYGADREKDIRFTQNYRIFSETQKYLSKMYCQLYQYYDLSFWSKDAGGERCMSWHHEKKGASGI